LVLSSIDGALMNEKHVFKCESFSQKASVSFHMQQMTRVFEIACLYFGFHKKQVFTFHRCDI
jgi:hypothetical protein